MTRVLVIGGGMSGLSATHMLSDKGYQVTLIESSSFLGAGNRTFTYGGHPYTYGPRHFLTKDEKLFEFLNRYTPLRRIKEHEFLTYIERDRAFYHFPIHRDDVGKMPDRDKIIEELNNTTGVDKATNLEEFWLASVGPTLYSKFVETYSLKMWQIESNTEFDDFTWSPKSDI